MKKFLLIVFIIAFSTLQAQGGKDFTDPADGDPINGGPIVITPPKPAEVGITEGQLSVSLSGAATYNIPIAVPPGLAGVAPQISLAYNSQGGNGMAGYGWNVAGISSISRIPSTIYHDGVIDAVDFDNLDRFALDGQRLIVKSGTSGVYGANGTYYETENFSNLKISSWGVHPKGINYGPAYFLLEYPDGSVALYGYFNDSVTPTEWGINVWQNPQGIRIAYNYTIADNSLSIATIKYGNLTTNAFVNEISFVYKSRQRPEKVYVGGELIVKNNILTQIRVKGNNVGFRNYVLQHNVSSLGYERLTNFTEKCGDNTLAYNPLVFSYEDTSETVTYTPTLSNISLNNINALNHSSVSGDFNGDGSLDFIIESPGKVSYSLFNGNATNNYIGKEVAVSGSYDQIFATSFLTGNVALGFKLFPKQCWTVVSGNGRVYNTYSLDYLSNVTLESSKTINIPSRYSTYCQSDPYGGGCGMTTVNVDTGKKVLNGDFNGDGLTDVMVIENSNIVQPNDCNTVYDEYGNPSCTTTGYSGGTTYTSVYFVDLDKRIPSATSMLSIGSLNNYITGYWTGEVLDFNGDGKSDFMTVQSGKVTVYSLNNANDQLQQLCVVQNGNIDPLKPVLVGDYNGDGKSDFIIPNGYGTSYTKFLSDGNTFISVVQTYAIANLQNNTGYLNGVQNYGAYNFPYFISSTFPNFLVNNSWYRNIIPNDFNGDGKTDLILLVNGTPNNNNFISIRVFKNIENNFVDAGFASYIDASLTENYPIPVFISPNSLNKKIELAVVSGNKLVQFKSQKDFNKDKLLKKVTNGNGVTETISYKPLISESCPYNCNNIFTPLPLVENFPKSDITVAPTFNVVSKLEKQSAEVYKKQLFTYYGAVTELSGLGFLGFRASMKTNWHDDNHQIISSVARYDVNLRGANVENYSIASLENPSNQSPTTNFISKNLNTYNKYDNQPFENPLQPNKVFKLKNTKNVQINGLDPSTAESINLYDAFNNPTQTTVTLKNGNNIEQLTNSIIVYENLPNNSPYIIGRPTSKTQSISIYPNQANQDTTSSEELYGYTNNLLTQIQRRGTNSGITTPFVVEDNIYDGFGNITKKTITAPGLAPRVTFYEYNPTAPFYGRFLTKSTDIEGLATNFVYDGNTGLLNSETTPYGLTTTHFYDKWFKKIKVTDYLGKSKNIKYERIDLNTKVTTITDDGGASFELFDDLGRKTTTGVKNINGVFSNISYLHDLYDRNYSTSEPYFDDYAYLWSQTSYDIYNRPTQSIAATGKIINISYNGFSTTIDDGLKTKTSVKNATGKTILLTDAPGGTINYTYFANGNLKQTIFDTAVTTIEQDGYGRKSKLTDPSAGIFKYEYNVFGELTKEIKLSQNNGAVLGTTTIDLSATGKVNFKTIIGQNGDTTNTKATYTYDANSKLLTNTRYDDYTNGYYTLYNYGYDNFKRLNFKDESGFLAYFQQAIQYDDFGRTAKELYMAISTDNKRSDKWISYSYKNGYKYQIIDDDTGKVLYQINDTNPRNQLTDASLGDYLSETHAYDDYGFAAQSNFSVTNGVNFTGLPFLTLTTSFDAQRGNLLNRQNSMFNSNDVFQYDNLDRLTSYPSETGTITTQAYDNKGRITANKIGTYAYTVSPYQISSVTPPFAGAPSELYYDAREQNVTYNFFKSPITITVANKENIDFEYNAFQGRATMFYGNTASKSNRLLRKMYSADGSMEIKYDNAANKTLEFVTYIGGDGYTAPIVLKSDGYTQSYLYLQRDYQGSILSITNETGFVLEKRMFDAWGNLIKYTDASGLTTLPTTANKLLLDRGYTGHEHLLGVELINMNARLYDPKFHRFLQPDNYVQDPSNTQSYNRYAYCWNNPLKYADYNGEYFGWDDAAVAFIGGVINWGTHGFKLNAEGAGYFVTGAAASVATYYGGPYAGAAVLGIGNSLTEQVSQNGWNNISGEKLLGDTAMSVGTAYFGGQLAKGISPYFDKFAGQVIKNSVVKEALSQGLTNATSGFVMGVSVAAFSGGDVNSIFEAGFKGAISGFSQGVISGLTVGYINYVKAKTVSNGDYATKPQANTTNDNVEPNTINGSLANGIHPVTGVPFDKNGYPIFSDYLYKKGLNDVLIQPTNSRANDFRAANQAAGYTTTPKGYTWHHHQNTGRMQLVESAVHAKTGHTGGFSLWKSNLPHK